MENNNDMRLYYEWDTKRAQLDFAIKAAENQLASVNKRLQDLQHDVYIYGGLLTVPLIVYKILTFILDNLFSFEAMVMYSLIYIFLELVCIITIVLYLIGFPFNLYYLIKTIMLLKANREAEDDEFQPPDLLEPLYKTTPKQEPTYRSEYNKLVYILSRYYIYEETMDSLLKKIDSGSMSMLELKMELYKLSFYEDIRPANTFSSTMAKKARNTTFFILFGIVIVILLCIALIIFS